ncbi:unnamed protein product [Brassicogethes aeneus]|uniref:N-acetyltransferase domain-containing protein n=1 Tax=Brassicogethes aeneus TaxID=1431903 RepID=A0A9P0B4Q6_BRAAE|nr:unnamed protein product [Brassicogethes aeneus]
MPVEEYLCSKRKKYIKLALRESDYIFLRANKSDTDAILDLMKISYYTEEPTYTALQIEDPKISLEGASRSLAEGLSYVARCRVNMMGVLWGASINCTSNPWDPDLKEKLACSVQDPKLRQLFLFYAHIQRAPNLFKCFNVQKVYEIECVFVSPEHRYRGIAAKLIELSRNLGRDCGYKIIRCDATSAFTPTKNDYNEILNLMEKTYCKDEPTFKTLNIENPIQFLDLTTKYLQEGLSYVAKCKNDGKIVGAMINTEYTKVKREQRLKILQDPQYKKLLMFNEHTENLIDLSRVYGDYVEKIFQIKFAFIQKEYGQKNITGNLAIHVRNFAKQSGYRFIITVTTSSYTAAVAEKLNFKKIVQIPYKDLVGQDNKPLFNTEYPHLMFRVYILDTVNI